MSNPKVIKGQIIRFLRSGNTYKVTEILAPPYGGDYFRARSLSNYRVFTYGDRLTQPFCIIGGTTISSIVYALMEANYEL